MTPAPVRVAAHVVDPRNLHPAVTHLQIVKCGLVVRRLGHRHLVLLLQLVHTICPLLVAHLALGAAQLLRAQLDLERLALLGHLLSQVQ